MSAPDTLPPAEPTWFYRACGVLVRGLGASYFGWRILHPERVPKTGPVILASNHVSFADPPLIGAAIPRAICFLARESLFQQPLLAKLIRSLNAVPVDRDGGGPAGLRTVLSLLASGRVLLLFPEGTRSPDGKIHAAKGGIGLAVVRSGAPVVPVRVFGLYEVWGRQRRFPKPGRITIKFGAVLRFKQQRQEAETASRTRIKEIYDEVTREVMQSISHLEPCRDIAEFAKHPGNPTS